MYKRQLKESGLKTISEPTTRDQGFDFGVWSDDLQKIVGNPLFVQVKTKLIDYAHAQRCMRQLSAATIESGTLWGLLLYYECNVPLQKLTRSSPPNILILSIQELLESMKSKTFAQVVINLRNRRVHGGNY